MAGAGVGFCAAIALSKADMRHGASEEVLRRYAAASASLEAKRKEAQTEPERLRIATQSAIVTYATYAALIMIPDGGEVQRPVEELLTGRLEPQHMARLYADEPEARDWIQKHVTRIALLPWAMCGMIDEYAIELEAEHGGVPGEVRRTYPHVPLSVLRRYFRIPEGATLPEGENDRVLQADMRWRMMQELLRLRDVRGREERRDSGKTESSAPIPE